MCIYFSFKLYIGNDTETPTMSPVVPDRVDLRRFPRVSEVTFFELELHPGDILYVPRDWPHYVSHDKRAAAPLLKDRRRNRAITFDEGAQVDVYVQLSIVGDETIILSL